MVQYSKISIIHCNRLKKKKNHIIVSIGGGKAFLKIQYSFMIKKKTVRKTGRRRDFCNLVKNIYRKLTTDIILKDKKLYVRDKARITALPFLLT